MKKEEMQLISEALKDALWLISEEYQTIQDEEWKKTYDKVIEKLEKAIKQVKTYDRNVKK